MRGDMHMHSTYSDGSFTVVELMEMIKAAKLDIVALTDHDTIDGVEEMIALGKKNNVIVIPGLELSTKENDESIHVLGYFKSVDSISQDFKDYLKGMKTRRYERLKEMTRRVNEKFGFNISFDEIAREHPNMLERPHLADAIGKITGESRKECFKKYIGNDSPCFIQASKISVADGIKMIHDAGGIAVLAHPYAYHKNNPMDLIDLGVDGVEVFYGPEDRASYKKYKDYAEMKGLIMTGGSDFHTHNDGKHVDVGNLEYTSPYIEKFLEKIEEL